MTTPSTATTMTCRQLGGPCDHELTAATADELIKAQDRHLKLMVGDGDKQHEPALQEMMHRWRRPISGMKWYRSVKRSFAEMSSGSSGTA